MGRMRHFLIAFFAVTFAATEPPKDSALFGVNDGRKSSELKVVALVDKKIFPDPWITGWSDGQSIVYSPGLVPGRYRVSAFILPQGAGSLTVKAGDGPLNRRPIPVSRGAYKSHELKMGEVDIYEPEAQLILACENSSRTPVGFGLIRVQMTKVGPPSPRSAVKSPLEATAARKASEKIEAAEKEAASLRARLVGSKWSWHASHDFSGQAYPMTIHGEDELSLPWNPSTPYKVIDGRTIDVYFSTTSFWRLKLSDDLRSFKTDMAVGMKQPKSGKLLSAPASASGGK